jgi:hypothetical protein
MEWAMKYVKMSDVPNNLRPSWVRMMTKYTVQCTGNWNNAYCVRLEWSDVKHAATAGWPGSWVSGLSYVDHNLRTLDLPPRYCTWYNAIMYTTNLTEGHYYYPLVPGGSGIFKTLVIELCRLYWDMSQSSGTPLLHLLFLALRTRSLRVYHSIQLPRIRWCRLSFYVACRVWRPCVKFLSRGSAKFKTAENHTRVQVLDTCREGPATGQTPRLAFHCM